MNDSKNAHARAQKILSLAVFLGLAAMASVATAQTDSTSTTTDGSATSDGATTEAAEAPAPADEASTSETPATTPATTEETAPTSDTSTADTGTEGSSTTETEASQTGTGTSTTATTTPTSDNPDEAAEEVQTEREPLAWRNSYFNYNVAASFCSFSRDCQLSYDPIVYQWISLSPRWYLDNSTFFSFYIPFYQEWTQDDSATYANEFQLIDWRISLNRRFPLGANFMILPSVGAWLPMSKGSQAAQRYFRLGAGASMTWLPVEPFNMTLSASYYHWFAGSNVPLTQSPYPASTAPSSGPTLSAPNGDPASNQANSTASEADRVTLGVTANWTPLAGFTITLQVFYFWVNGYSLAPASVAAATMTGDALTLPDNSAHWRAYDSYAIYFQYDFVPWLQGYIGFSNSTQLASVFSENGSVRSPVNLYDMQVTLGTFITLDGLYESFQTQEDDGLTPEQRQRRRQGLAQSTSSSSGSF